MRNLNQEAKQITEDVENKIKLALLIAVYVSTALLFLLLVSLLWNGEA